MTDSLEQVFTNFQQNCINVLFKDRPNFDLSIVTNELLAVTQKTTIALVKTMLEMIDDAFIASPDIQKKYKVEHLKRIKTIHSKIGDISYNRTYFQNRNTLKYSFLIDNYIHVDSHQRLTNDLIIEVAKAAILIPYRQVSTIVTNNTISPQTVMNAIRRTEPVPVTIEKKKKVKVLHLDVDEDHVTIINDGKSKKDIVRLVVSYEDVQDGKCINPIAIGRYDKNADNYWETVMNELCDRYDLTDTTIYVHADGAPWIAKAEEYFTNVKFVLDAFHKNKYIRKIFSCVNDKVDKDNKVEKCFRQALADRNIDVVIGFYDYIKNKYIDTISKDADKAINYLLNNIDGIAICKNDKEAKRCGFSEQHVSNYLSLRLSSRPRRWSIETLNSLVPMLTARTEIRIKETPVVPVVSKTVIVVEKTAKTKIKKMLYSYNPDSIGNIPVLATGKVDPLYNSVSWINR